MSTHWKNSLRITNKNNFLGRQFKIFAKQLAEDNWRPCYLTNGQIRKTPNAKLSLPQEIIVAQEIKELLEKGAN